MMLAAVPIPAPAAGRTWGATGSSGLVTDNGVAAGSIAFTISGVHGGQAWGDADLGPGAQTHLALTCGSADVLGDGWHVQAAGIASDGWAYAVEVTTEQGGTMANGGTVEVRRGTLAGCDVDDPAVRYRSGPSPEVAIGEGGLEALRGSGTIVVEGDEVTVSVDVRALLGQGAGGALTIGTPDGDTALEVVCTATQTPTHDTRGARWWTVIGRAPDGAMYEVFIDDAAYRWSADGDAMAIDIAAFPPPMLSVCSLGGTSRPQALLDGNFVTSDGA